MKCQLPETVVGGLASLHMAQAGLKEVMYKDDQAWTLGVDVGRRYYKFSSDVVKSRSQIL